MIERERGAVPPMAALLLSFSASLSGCASVPSSGGCCAKAVPSNREDNMDRRPADPLAFKRLEEVTTLTFKKVNPLTLARNQVRTAIKEASIHADARVTNAGHRHLGIIDPEHRDLTEHVAGVLRRLGLEYTR